MRNSDIKYRHLFAWDCMMLSGQGWRERMQELAAEEQAPLDVIYRKTDEQGNAVWNTYGSVTSPTTKLVIENFFEQRGWGKP